MKSIEVQILLAVQGHRRQMPCLWRIRQPPRRLSSVSSMFNLVDRFQISDTRPASQRSLECVVTLGHTRVNTHRFWKGSLSDCLLDPNPSVPPRLVLAISDSDVVHSAAVICWQNDADHLFGARGCCGFAPCCIKCLDILGRTGTRGRRAAGHLVCLCGLRAADGACGRGAYGADDCPYQSI